MAVFYKWIKGCAEGASLSDKQWSYVEWGSNNTTIEDDGENVINVFDTITTTIMPRLKASVGRKNTLYTATDDGVISLTDGVADLGYFLTNNMPTPYIIKPWGFNKISFYQQNATTDDESKLCGAIYGDYQLGYANLNKVPSVYVEGNLSISQTLDVQDQVVINGYGSSKLSDNPWLSVQGYSEFTGNIKILSGGLTLSRDDIIVEKGCVKVAEDCVEAVYFNATSDKRSKENIQLATYSALELINKLPIYTFNYKNQKETVTGILAQDLLETQPKELDLVSNINATGEDNDYMSIKNDKLMFVLMKAIQEQQEQIEALKLEIENIKKII